MRDQTIMNGLESISNNFGKDLAQIQKLNILCKTRIDAIEEIIFGSPINLIKAIFFLFFSRRKLNMMVYDMHDKHLKAYQARQEKLREAYSKGLIVVK